jgi:hypothetical protein
MKSEPLNTMPDRSARLAAGGMALALCLVSPALAQEECLQADAYYADRDRHAVIAFSQAYEEEPGISNRFALLIGDAALEGIVMWSGGVERPQAILLHDCPEGTVTAGQLDACTLWRGTVYSIGAEGDVGLLPGAHDVAAERLLFPGLPWQLSYSEAFAAMQPGDLPFELFERTGCAQ